MEASSGITKRWITNTLIGVIVVLLLFSITLLMITQNYYISTVDLKLNSQYSNSVAAFFSNYIGSSSERFEAGARTYVENFSQKDIMEVWVIDADGNVVEFPNVRYPHIQSSHPAEPPWQLPYLLLQ